MSVKMLAQLGQIQENTDPTPPQMEVTVLGIYWEGSDHHGLGSPVRVYSGDDIETIRTRAGEWLRYLYRATHSTDDSHVEIAWIQ